MVDKGISGLAARAHAERGPNAASGATIAFALALLEMSPAPRLEELKGAATYDSDLSVRLHAGYATKLIEAETPSPSRTSEPERLISKIDRGTGARLLPRQTYGSRASPAPAHNTRPLSPEIVSVTTGPKRRVGGAPAGPDGRNLLAAASAPEHRI